MEPPRSDFAPMRPWLLGTARGTAFTQSAAISLVTHVTLIGAAVYGTDKAATELAEQRNEQVVFLAPPDRLPSSDGADGRLQFLTHASDGAGAAVAARAAAVHAEEPAHDGKGPDAGQLALGQAPQAEVVSDDSVYSVLSAEENATRVEGSAAPVYPAEMLRKGIEGLVVARFIIDTTGRADPASLEIMQSSNAAFVLSVRDAVPGMRFSPAMVRGRHVRQLVQQSFAFRLAVPMVAADHTGTNPVP